MNNKVRKKLFEIVVLTILAFLPLTEITSATPSAYITSGDHNVSVLDTATNNITAIVNVGKLPLGIAVNPDGTKAYVVNFFDQSVSVIDAGTNVVTATVKNVGVSPVEIVVSPDGTKAYVVNEDGNVSVINTGTNTVTTIVNVGNIPGGEITASIAANPDGKAVYVGNQNVNTVSVIDTASNVVMATVNIGTPRGIAVSPDGTKVYVANFSSNLNGYLSIINAETNVVTTTVNIGKVPSRVAVSPDGTRIYVTNSGDNTVSVIDAGTNTIIATVNVGRDPFGVAVNPDGTRIYVVNVIDGTVSVIDAGTNTVTATVNVGFEPTGIAMGKIGSISGTKYNDLNGNGIHEVGEPGLANWTITLAGPNNTGLKTQITGTDGNYSFTNLTLGNYEIGEVIQPGWIQTVPSVSAAGSATYKVQISGNTVKNIDFGNFKLGKVNGQKFEDLNANGIKDPEELGLTGWMIDLTGTDTITGQQVNLTTITDSNGNYNFTGLTAGTYSISEELKNGWVRTIPVKGIYTANITSGSDIKGQSFGNFHKGKITGGGWISIPGDSKSTFGIVGQYPDSSNIAHGNVEYQDHFAKLNIKSMQINTVATTFKKGVITGIAQVNGAGNYPFEVYVEDNGEPGKGIDVFKISLPTYPYSNGAILSGGNIQIHK